MIARMGPLQTGLAGLCAALVLVFVYEVAAPLSAFEVRMMSWSPYQGFGGQSVYQLKFMFSRGIGFAVLSKAVY